MIRALASGSGAQASPSTGHAGVAPPQSVPLCVTTDRSHRVAASELCLRLLHQPQDL